MASTWSPVHHLPIGNAWIGKERAEAPAANMMSDQELVRKMREGDQLAFAEFFDQHFARLFRFSLRRLNGNEDAAEEVVQIAMTRAMRKLDTWRGEAPLFTWLCTFCRFEISAWVAKQRNEAPLADAEAIEARSDLEVKTVVHDALDSLPKHYGDVLEWKYVEGLTVREIADRLQSGIKAAESMLTRARVAFREVFHE